MDSLLEIKVDEFQPSASARVYELMVQTFERRQAADREAQRKRFAYERWHMIQRSIDMRRTQQKWKNARYTIWRYRQELEAVLHRILRVYLIILLMSFAVIGSWILTITLRSAWAMIPVVLAILVWNGVLYCSMRKGFKDFEIHKVCRGVCGHDHGFRYIRKFDNNHRERVLWIPV
jgi:hypothetical protein